MRIQLLALLGLSLVACRSDNGGGVGVDAPPKLKVKDIQNDAMMVGTEVHLEGVIVTAVDKFGARTGELFVQDPEGGEFSGVKVFNGPTDVISTLQPGDIVTITGAKKDEFALSSDMTGKKTTELIPTMSGSMVITKTGAGAPPTPVAVDAVAIGKLPEAQQAAEWEKWEGVLITVNKVTQATFITSFGSANPTPDDSFKFEVDGGLTVESTQFKFDNAYDINVCYSSITGVSDYFFDYLLLPRSAADMGAPTTGCDAAQIPTATIAQVQSGAKTGKVLLKDVYVTALSNSKKQLWVSTSLTAAANEGVYVYRGGNASTLPAEIVPGAKVSINGSTTEFNNDATGETLTQVQFAAIKFVAAPTAAPTGVMGMTAAQIMMDAPTTESYESVLVTLTDVKVTAIGANPNYTGQLTQGTTTFVSDDDIFRLLAAEANKCYASITGMWSYLVYDNTYVFLPLAVGTGTGTCP